MNIKTKYNTNDKVWYYIEEINKYCWGKVICMDIDVRIGIPRIIYEIDNRFFKKEEYDYHSQKSYSNRAYWNLPESEVFASVEALITSLEKKHKSKMYDLDELKKTSFLW